MRSTCKAWALTTVLWLTTMDTARAVAKLKDLQDYKDHPCVRPCTETELPRRCEYDWTVELYYTLSKACYDCPFNITDCDRPHCVPADGTSRGILTVNRVLPGPGVQVCEGDEVVVNVRNALETSGGTTIHWHGHRQRGSQVMDGVSLVTQCPIPHMSTFQYRFKADDPGTHWWHSHAGLQRSNGLFGSFIIRQKPSRDPHSALYDLDLPEHVISVTDWLIEMTENRFAAHHHDDGDNKPASMIINGKGAFTPLRHPDTNATFYTPYAEFKVKPGLRYRFRVISAAFMNCPIQLSIDGHTLMVIASDGGSFDPIVVDSFNMFAGERFDFVLIAHNASQPEGRRNYWLRVRGMGDCGVKDAHQVAVLRYEGAPPTLPTEDTSWAASERGGRKLNPWNKKGTDTLIPVDRLTSTEPDAKDAGDDTLKEIPDRKYYVAMEFNKIDNFHYDRPGLYPLSALPQNKHLYSPQINNIAFQLPPVPPLTQFSHLDEQKQFCSPQTVQVRCKTQYCECTQRIKVQVGEVVELVVLDEGVTFNTNHPMHLHGYHFRVIGLDKLNESTSLSEIQRLDAQGLLRRKLRGAVLKDTVTVPDGGYTIIRFKADNPGMWLMHCHIEFHNAVGMGLVIQVGEPSQFPPRPPRFPTCGDWRLGKDDEDEDDDDGYDSGTNGAAPTSPALRGALAALWVIVLAIVRC